MWASVFTTSQEGSRAREGSGESVGNSQLGIHRLGVCKSLVSGVMEYDSKQ